MDNKINNIYTVSEKVALLMRQKAKDVVAKFSNNVGIYGHNKVERQVKAYMSEYAVKMLYGASGIKCFQNIKDSNAPDLTISEYDTLNGHVPMRHEEVKCWATGFSWDEYGCTITEYHAERYMRKQRARVWFCEVDLHNRTVVVHGWATPDEILASETRITSSGVNHQVEVLHRCREVMPNVEDIDTSLGWF